jgi:beta-galactosidase
MRGTLILMGLLSCAAHKALAQTQEYVIDATAAVSPPETGFLKFGSSRSPSGRTISATSRYLTRDGKPWLPVMGEFHYSRFPEDKWEEEILKMKVAGVQIVASYVIWIHHEEEKGKFNWTGQRNLRRFVELVGKHGMYAYPRIGPWSHAEVRSGGFPDWLVREVGTGLRSNDSTYLRYVERFYQQIAQQVQGQLWKQGGPIIGIQLENEYNQRGAGRGEEHIIALKRLAVQAGFDVPLYTITGWDNAVLPPAEVIPVFGGYPDMPWDASVEELPPGEVYAFRFHNRWAGNMGAQGPAQQLNPTAQAALTRYPFLGAEYGGGIQITYHRRPVISAHDVAAMLPVQIGSGVNLYGYYMFHGGTNPAGALTTLQESQRTGYPTDVPVKSYDFQTLLTEFGELRTSFRKTKLMHYFLNEFGEQLAPMVVREPQRVPRNPADTSVLRIAARTLDERGFLFVNNYIRNYSMPARANVQLTVRLPREIVRVPEQPINVPAGAYFLWPINLDVNGALLKYSTAQLLTRLDAAGVATYVFFAVPGIVPEFVFDAASVSALTAPNAAITRAAQRIRVRNVRTGPGIAISLRTRDGQPSNIVLLSQAQAENAWRVSFAGAERLVWSAQEVFADATTLHFAARGRPDFAFGVFPALARTPRASIALRNAGQDGLFTRYVAAQRPVPAAVRVTKVRAADPIGPVKLFNAVTWRKVEIALAPSDSAFAGAARYSITVPPALLRQLPDVFLEIHYVGDVARLYTGDELLTDNFYNGTPWRVSAQRFADAIRRGPLELRILPLRKDAPIYIPTTHRPRTWPGTGQQAELLKVVADPVYHLTVTAQ